MSVAVGSDGRDTRVRPLRFVAATVVWGALYDEFIKDDGPWSATEYAVVFAGGFAINYALKFTGGT